MQSGQVCQDRHRRCAARENLLNREINVNILNIGRIENTPTGQLILTVMLAFAEFERSIIAERTQAGKLVAKQSPSYREGRPRKIQQGADIARAFSFIDALIFSGGTAHRNKQKHTYKGQKRISEIISLIWQRRENMIIINICIL